MWSADDSQIHVLILNFCHEFQTRIYYCGCSISTGMFDKQLKQHIHKRTAYGISKTYSTHNLISKLIRLKILGVILNHFLSHFTSNPIENRSYSTIRKNLIYYQNSTAYFFPTATACLSYHSIFLQLIQYLPKWYPCFHSNPVLPATVCSP